MLKKCLSKIWGEASAISWAEMSKFETSVVRVNFTWFALRSDRKLVLEVGSTMLAETHFADNLPQNTFVTFIILNACDWINREMVDY